jgi:hypothetical protein
LTSAKEKEVSTLYATFNDSALAEKAIGALLDYGVHNEDISVLSKEPGTRDFEETEVETPDGYYTEAVPVYDDPEDERAHLESAGKHGLSTTTSGDAKAGAAKGAGIGLGVGVAAAIASLVVPGFGLVLGGGALAVALAGTAGATAAGAAAGGVTGYLKDQGVPEPAAADYDRAFKNGSAVLSVNVPSGDGTEIEIENILSKYRATYLNIYGGMNN